MIFFEIKCFEVRSFKVKCFEVKSFEIKCFEVKRPKVKCFEVKSFEIKCFKVKSFRVKCFKLKSFELKCLLERLRGRSLHRGTGLSTCCSTRPNVYCWKETQRRHKLATSKPDKSSFVKYCPALLWMKGIEAGNH